MAEERGPVLSLVIEDCDELRASDEKIVPDIPEKKTVEFPGPIFKTHAT